MGYLTATWLLTLKNVRILCRRPGSLVVVVVAAFAAMLVMFLLQRSFDRGDGVGDYALKNTDPEPFSLQKIPRCIPSSYPDCVTLAYVPSGDTRVKTWVETVATRNDIPIATETKGFPNSQSLNKYLAENPNRTQAAYVFEAYNMDQLRRNSISFIVQYNLTEQKVFPIGESFFNEEVVLPSMIHAMNDVLRPVVGAPGVSVDLKASAYPHPQLFTGDNAFLQIGSFLLFSVYFLVLVTFMSRMTEEKEIGLRDAMRLAGMAQSQHFISWGIPMFVTMSVVTLVILALGHAFRFNFFVNTAFPVYFLSFFTFSLSLIGWTFFLCAFIQHTRRVSNFAFLLFILMYMIGTFASIVYVDKPNGEPLVAQHSLYWREVLAILPSTMFVRCISSIAIVTAQDFNLPFSEVSIYPPTYSLRTCWLWMLGSGAVAFALSIYLDNVLPTPHGSPLSPIYFLQPSYWKSILSRGKRVATSSPEASSSDSEVEGQFSDPSQPHDINPSDSIGYDPQEEDPAVQRERDRVARGERDADPLVIKNIVRCFKKFTAVDRVSLSVARNTAFACLGHNGAGKSTLFKMLVTSIGVTSGDAFIYGQSVQNSQAETRRMLGVCQQHDALWESLSGSEHIELFAALKGLDRSGRESEMKERLVDVGLSEFSDRPAGAYSGGMQRRLSVAISLTGNPRILLLDEFSTGADPLVRRDLWATIERAKKNRVVFIITHSMAEAEHLGDRIGIMSQGKLRVLGSSLYLKNKFGAGYRVVVKLSSHSVSTLNEKLVEVCPGSSLIESSSVQPEETAVLAQFSLPRRSSDENVLKVTRMLEERKEELGILEFTLDSASLDQVFKSITSLSADVVEPDFKEKKKCFPCFGNSKDLQQ